MKSIKQQMQDVGPYFQFPVGSSFEVMSASLFDRCVHVYIGVIAEKISTNVNNRIFDKLVLSTN